MLDVVLFNIQCSKPNRYTQPRVSGYGITASTWSFKLGTKKWIEEKIKVIVDHEGYW